ncbi:hypothetical protein HWN39_10750 [Lactobacillus rhamnosus]|uniref:Baseplate upper protein immunoglobulin like domain-containing protein n=1 Tax=Lacticaseibacillus rhamnosus TaxID=47715 RepID=A0A7Y7QGV9_LACRH|nr:hypothetical protein [Lacticaseibacillus rhamnosus]NVO88957.1 hypothetical protein [Lacticaseibacillus rhamnosus]
MADQNDDYYRDKTHIDPNNDIKQSTLNMIIDDVAEELATWIREKKYGVDVRESLALFAEWLDGRQNGVEKDFKDLGTRQTTVENRQTDAESNIEKVLKGLTDGSHVDPAAEVIAARHSKLVGDYETLGLRLDDLRVQPKWTPIGNIRCLPSTDGTYANIRAFVSTYGAGVVQANTDIAGGTSLYPVEVGLHWVDTDDVALQVDVRGVKQAIADFSMTKPQTAWQGEYLYLTSGIYTLTIQTGGREIQFCDLDDKLTI